MIFDLLTSHQGHPFKPRVKSLLALCSTYHPLQFDMPHDHFWIFLNPPGRPQGPNAPQVQLWGKTQGDRTKILFDMLIFFICENKDWYKNFFESDFVTEIKWYLTFNPSLGPQGAVPKTSG